MLSSILPSTVAILESEPFAVSLKSTKDARKLGEDFAKELGELGSLNSLQCTVMSF